MAALLMPFCTFVSATRCGYPVPTGTCTGVNPTLYHNLPGQGGLHGYRLKGTVFFRPERGNIPLGRGNLS